jgi:hypothetical protein
VRATNVRLGDSSPTRSVKTMASPTRTPTRTVQPSSLGQLGHEPVIQWHRGQLVRARGEDERPRPEVKPAVALDEIAASE